MAQLLSKIDSAKRKPRKTVDGPIRNRESTKSKILIARGKLFSKDDYTGLNVMLERGLKKMGNPGNSDTDKKTEEKYSNTIY